MKTSKSLKVKNHGIVVIKHKTHSTKKIYNNGYLMRCYRNCPLEIKFQNKMVNDINQHYCGGWFMSDLKYGKSAELDLLLSGNKPLLDLHSNSKQELIEISKSLDTTKFDYEIYNNWLGYWFIVISVKGKMKDLFDLETLKEDYANAGIPIDIEKIKNQELKNYFKGWVNHGNPLGDDPWELWEMGLMLGYPIENTISIYLQ